MEVSIEEESGNETTVIHPRLVKSAHNRGICNSHDLLKYTPFDILNILGAVNMEETDAVLKALSVAVAPGPSTAFDLLQTSKDSALKTGLVALDDILLGGFRSGTITELAGPAGCGKTQFCYQLALQTTLPTNLGGKDGSVLYIDTEQVTSAGRLIEMCTNRWSHYFSDDSTVNKHLSRILIFQTSSCDKLMTLLRHQMQEIIIERNVKLVIVDSIASIMRKEFDNNSTDKTSLLLEQASILKEVAEGFNIPVIVVNQVTVYASSLTDYTIDSESSDSLENQRLLIPHISDQVRIALGNTWCHAVNTRILLQYRDSIQRELIIGKSPMVAAVSFDYVIEDSGLVFTSVANLLCERDVAKIQTVRTRDTSIPQFTY